MAQQPYEESQEDTFAYEDDWKEMIGDAQPGGGVHASAGAQEATLVGIIPFNKQRSALRSFIGLSYADSGSPYALHREQPAVHPVHPQLRAHDMTVAGLRVKPNRVDENDPDSDYTTPKTQSPFFGANDETLYYANYEKAIATVRYKSFGRTRFLRDDEIDDYSDEWKRNWRWTADPSVEALSADGTSFLKFAEGPPATGGTGGAALTFPAPLAVLMSKVALAGTWLNVAHDYVSSDPDIFVADKIFARLGTVNSTAFLGFYAQTLLLRAVKAEEVIFPVPTDDPTNYPAMTGWNLTFVWEFFDPPNGAAVSPYNSTRHGHNLMPYRGTGVVGDSTGGKWYYCTRTGSVTDPPLLTVSDHYKIMQHVSDPS